MDYTITVKNNGFHKSESFIFDFECRQYGFNNVNVNAPNDDSAQFLYLSHKLLGLSR